MYGACMAHTQSQVHLFVEPHCHSIALSHSLSQQRQSKTVGFRFSIQLNIAIEGCQFEDDVKGPTLYVQDDIKVTATG